MKQDVLLPGVTRAVNRRQSSHYDRSTVQRAQQREDVRDLADLVVLAAVDALALGWDAAHIPLLSRETTLDVLLVANAVVGAFLLGRRLVPVLLARRVSSTWNDDERRK